jgi:hypothetical protein
MTDRDRRRLGDPLHDTVDESDRVVVGVIDPDPTPVHHVVDRITAIVGELSDDARSDLIAVLGGHDKRAKTRAANHLLATVAVDQRKVIAEVDRDLPEWVREINERTDKAEARAVAAEKLARDANARWKWPMRIVSGLAAASLGAAGWLLTETRASGYAAKTEEIYRAQVDANTKAISELREAFAEMRGQLNRPYPFRVLPVSGPRNDPDKDETP